MDRYYVYTTLHHLVLLLGIIGLPFALIVKQLGIPVPFNRLMDAIQEKYHAHRDNDQETTTE